VLFELRDEAGFDHLSCVIAQEYHDRYESIYHLTEYDRRTREVSVVVPSPTDDPYGYYPELDWEVVTEDGCDNYARVLVRLGEIEQSARIVEQCIDLLEDWPEDDRRLQSNVPRTLRPGSDTEIYRAVEIVKGELGVHIRSDGTDSPARFKIRSPCFHNLSTLPEMAEGELIADLIAALGSLDIVLGSVDR